MVVACADPVAPAEEKCETNQMVALIDTVTNDTLTVAEVGFCVKTVPALPRRDKGDEDA